MGRRIWHGRRSSQTMGNDPQRGYAGRIKTCGQLKKYTAQLSAAGTPEMVVREIRHGLEAGLSIWGACCDGIHQRQAAILAEVSGRLC